MNDDLIAEARKEHYRDPDADGHWCIQGCNGSWPCATERLALALEHAERSAAVHIRVAETIARAFARRMAEIEES